MPKAKPAKALAEPGKGMSGEQEVKLMYDMMVTAFQTDATRVVFDIQRQAGRPSQKSAVELPAVWARA